MRSITVLGGGRIGRVVAEYLASCGDYLVLVVDQNADALAQLSGERIRVAVMDVSQNPQAFRELLAGSFALMNAAPFYLAKPVAEIAVLMGVNYLDLTEDVASTRYAKELSAVASAAIIPQCGLAPGFISIVANDLATRFENLETLRLRVGALPQYPCNALNYNLTWSTQGIINQYCEPCEALVDGQKTLIPALQDREEFLLDGVTYEAFNTSGGLGSLCDTLTGRVRTLNYQTVRYPGHCAIMRALVNDLRLRERRHILEDILDYAIPTTEQDVVVIFVTANGQRDGHLIQEAYANKIYSERVGNRRRSAIQRTTASAACAILDLLAGGRLPQRGFVRQEDVPLDTFLTNRFGQTFASAER